MNPHAKYDPPAMSGSGSIPPVRSTKGQAFPGRPKASGDSYVILRLPAVLRARGRSRSTHYLDIQQGLFTRPVSIGARAVGWPEHEVEVLNEARIAGKGDDEVRALVASLEADRKGGQA